MLLFSHMAEQRSDGVIAKDQLRKPVLMPSGDKMMARLKEQKLIGGTPDKDAFYSRLVGDLSQKEINAVGLNLAWDLTKATVMRRADIEVRNIFNTFIDPEYGRAINAITPDPEVASAAIQFRNETVKKAREAQEVR